jgi:hypothetical protein
MQLNSFLFLCKQTVYSSNAFIILLVPLAHLRTCERQYVNHARTSLGFSRATKTLPSKQVGRILLLNHLRAADAVNNDRNLSLSETTSSLPFFGRVAYGGTS